jgi:hypothetical protein
MIEGARTQYRTASNQLELSAYSRLPKYPARQSRWRGYHLIIYGFRPINPLINKTTKADVQI